MCFLPVGFKALLNLGDNIPTSEQQVSYQPEIRNYERGRLINSFLKDIIITFLILL
jgi:hypothetical protein